MEGLYLDNESYPYKEDWLYWQAIKEMTNVTLDIQPVSNADYETRYQMLLSSGEAPDFITKIAPGSETKFIASGVLTAISDYYDQMPYFNEKKDKWALQPEIEYIKQADGKVYYIPGCYEYYPEEWSFAIRADLLEKHKLATPTTYDEVLTVLKELKKVYPDSYPWTDRWNAGISEMHVARMFGINWGFRTTDQQIGYDYDKKEWFFIPTSDQYKSYIEYMAKAVAEGVFDTEAFVQQEEQFTNKISNSKTFFVPSNFPNSLAFTDQAKVSDPNARFEMLILPEGPAGNKIIGDLRHNTGIIIPSTSKNKPYFDTLIKFVDWLTYSDEAINLNQWGVEGKTYEVVDGKKQLLKDIEFSWMNKGAAKKLRNDFGFQLGPFKLSLSKEVLFEFMDDKEKDYQIKIDNKYDFLPPYPAAKLSNEDTDRLNQIRSSIEEYVNTSKLEFITGKKKIATDWDDYVAELKKRKSEVYLEIYNAALKR